MTTNEHVGEHEVFERSWPGHVPFYNDGDLESCRSFRELWENVKFRRLDDLLPQVPQRSLEVGCGSGGVSLYLHNRHGYEPTLTDLSDSALEFARHNFERNSRRPGWQERVRFEKADALQLPYPDASFDVVMSFGLLEHFTDIERPISEQLRVLRPGGVFLADIVTERFSVDTVGRFPALLRKAVKALAHGDLRGAATAGDPGFFENRYPLRQYAGAVERLGGRITRAMGNRPFTEPSGVPLLPPVLLALYKTAPAQAAWRAFDFSGSAFSKWWGAGWWLVAEKHRPESAG
jgi:SAM-dependent methyltransferase